MSKRPTEILHTDLWMADGTVHWVDVQLGGAKRWKPLFTYRTLESARKARDSMKESGLIWAGENGCYGGFDEPITDARVRVVSVKVEVAA